MRLHILETRQLNRLLSRERQRRQLDEDAPALDQTLKEVLRKANQFVPSEAGSILLDDPFRKKGRTAFQELVFVACFGVGSANLPGLQLPVNAGIVGVTYLSGKSSLYKDLLTDKEFIAKRDQLSRFRTRSIICAPIIIEKSVCGVIELINRKGQENYTEEELKLLEIFAGYTSTLIQNVLYARTHIKIAKLDGLTGLYNDRHFYERLDQDIRMVKKSPEQDLILLFIDMDHFKEVNDKYGHLVGSRVLKDIGDILTEVAPSEGTTIARYGGDEFIIIFTKMPLAEVKLVAQTICDAINKFEIADRAYMPKSSPEKRLQKRLTCSIGVVSLRDHVGYKFPRSEIRQRLIRKADAAMYRAKLSGKNRVCIASQE